MRFFRRNLDLSRASLRQTTAADFPTVSRLFRDGARRYQGFAGADLELLLGAAPCVVLDAADQLWGAAICSRRAKETIWLRGLALVEGLEVRQAVSALLLPLHAMVRSQGTHQIFYGGDDLADFWMQPALHERGYLADTDVVVYEKRTLEVPSYGNSLVCVRPALTADSGAVSELDRVCFDPQWTKDDHVIGPAIIQGPLFLVAELEGQIVGYAFATSHFGGRLIHLVRIAVSPANQGSGIGVRLLAEVVQYARQHSSDTITLNTQSYNIHAQRLYEWFGFQLTGERQTVLRYDLVQKAAGH